MVLNNVPKKLVKYISTRIKLSNINKTKNNKNIFLYTFLYLFLNLNLLNKIIGIITSEKL